MKLTLRDLFWLQVFVAIAICWGMEHRQQSKELKDLEAYILFFGTPGPKQPTNQSLARTKSVQELHSLSDEDLLKLVAKVFDEGSTRHSSVDTSCCLTELARRKMDHVLQRLYDDFKVKIDRNELRSESPELLTALRRARGHTDPLKIHVQVSREDSFGNAISIPQIVTTLQNVDALEESFEFLAGCDDRGGRRSRWRVRLADISGRVVEDSNFRGVGGGGIGSSGKLKSGAQLHKWFHLDLRSYVKPSPSGLYTLQVIHGDNGIANEPNLAGLIVWTSDPISVRVENLGPQKNSVAAMRFLGVGLIAGMLLLLNRLRIVWRQKSAGNSETVKSPFCRDLLCLGLIVVLTLCWLGDSYRLRTEILKYQPDSEADWTIWLEDD